VRGVAREDKRRPFRNGQGTNRVARLYGVTRQGARHLIAALTKSAGNPRRYSLCAQRHYRQTASDAAFAAEELPQDREQRLAQELQRPRPSRYAGMRLPTSVMRGRTSGALRIQPEPRYEVGTEGQRCSQMMREH
jgi:hypothetical protein